MKPMLSAGKPWMRRSMLALACCLLLVVGCSSEQFQSWFLELQRLISPVPTPSPTVAVTPTPAASPTEVPTATPASTVLELRFWIPDFLDPESDTTGAAVLSSQVASFSRMSSAVQVEMLVKKAAGAGGIYDLLSTASGVAPAIVPDLVVLGRQDLLAAAAEGLVQPLDDDLPSDAGYFDAALNDMRTTDGLWAFPYVATAEQMAYRTTVTTTAPITWTGVLSNGFSLVLPGASGDTVNSDVLLSMYIGAGGRTVDAGGQATLDRPVLEQVYAFVLEAIGAGLLNPEQSATLGTTAACWEAYRQGSATLTPVSVGTYWRAFLNTPVGEDVTTPTPEPEGAATPTPAMALLPADTLPTWIPTASGAPTTVIRTWGIAIVTQDATRREAALELLRWLVSAQQMGSLTRNAGLTPTRRQAVEAWNLASDEEAFVLRLLSTSVAAPPAGADLVVRRALQVGLSAIMQGDATTPDAAASQALTNLRR